MAQASWYNQNRNRCFPFLHGTVGQVPRGISSIRNLPHDWIVDAGFYPGPVSGFQSDELVRLQRIHREENRFFFTFVAESDQFQDHPLIFERDVDSPEYGLEHLEYFHPEGDPECQEPLWSGYLVTGHLDSLIHWLEDGQEILGDQDSGLVEPALIQNLDRTVLVALDLANADRVRYTEPVECAPLVWPFETGLVYPNTRCVRGAVRWKPGYNCSIRQDNAHNRITLAAVRGAGEGEPCAEVPLFVEESPPVQATNNRLVGGLECNEVVRSINGEDGPIMQIISGQGVTISNEPFDHRIRIRIHMVGMAVCWYSVSTFSEHLEATHD